MDDFKVLMAKTIKGSDDWYLLCHVPGSYQPWVTWRSSTMDGKGGRFYGHYYGTESEARSDFDSRG